MSYNLHFANNFRGNCTFRGNFMAPFVPPPPPPPPFFIPPAPEWKQDTVDQDLIKKIESKIILHPKNHKSSSLCISKVREELRSLIFMINTLKSKEKILVDNKDNLSDDDWNSNLNEIEDNKFRINKVLSNINDSYLEALRKLIAKRSAKRFRLKRLRLEKKREKEEKIKQLEERSRKIDENLQKIKNDINKAKQEEEAKVQSDIILKEVLCKRHDAKKCLVKLDALTRLRKARENTAKGRGEADSGSDAFNNNIEKLKSLWTQKLATYEQEEAELRGKLAQDAEKMNPASNETEIETSENLAKWREALFGGSMPQVDMEGDLRRFIAIRSQWDQFIDSEGSSLPIGWVPPPTK